MYKKQYPQPENLLVSSTGHLCLCDFGSATEVSESPEVDTQEGREDERRASGEGASSAGGERPRRRVGSFVGTADYIPPECLEKTDLSYAWDLWSLGCIIYQMYTGTPPFRCVTHSLFSALHRTMKSPISNTLHTYTFIRHLTGRRPNT